VKKKDGEGKAEYKEMKEDNTEKKNGGERE
jgi:hypothetical protein